MAQLSAASVREHDLLVVRDRQRAAGREQIPIRGSLSRMLAIDGSLGDILCP